MTDAANSLYSLHGWTRFDYALFAAAENALPGEARKATLLAAVRRLHYDASIAQGFSPDEALALCMESVRTE